MTVPPMPPAAEPLWRQFVTVDRRYHALRADLLRAFTSEAALSSLLRSALRNIDERATALRLLTLLNESVRRLLLPDLVQLAAFGHKDILLVREVLLLLDPEWREQHLPDEIEAALRSPNPTEEYRRLAELLRVLHSPYLATLVKSAAGSDNVDIREVAEDFGANEGGSDG